MSGYGWTKAEFDAAPEAITRLHQRILDLEGALDQARETLYAAGTFASHTNDVIARVGQMCLKEFERTTTVAEGPSMTATE